MPRYHLNEWMNVCMLSHVHLFANLWTVARQAPLSIGFSRQEYWSGLPFPSPGDLNDPWIKPTSPATPAGEFFPLWATGEEAWRAVIHGVANSWTWLSNWTELKIPLSYFPASGSSSQFLTSSSFSTWLISARKLKALVLFLYLLFFVYT